MYVLAKTGFIPIPSFVTLYLVSNIFKNRTVISSSKFTVVFFSFFLTFVTKIGKIWLILNKFEISFHSL